VFTIATRREGVAVSVFFLIAFSSALLSDHTAKSLFNPFSSVLFVGFATVLATFLSESAALACKANLIASAVTFAYVCWTACVDDGLHIWLSGRSDEHQSASLGLKRFCSSAA